MCARHTKLWYQHGIILKHYFLKSQNIMDRVGLFGVSDRVPRLIMTGDNTSPIKV